MKAKPEITRKVDKYWIPIIARTIELLDCFGPANESLTLEKLSRKLDTHTTAYRILHMLVLRDYLTQSGRQYRLNRLRRRLRFGFANLSKHICIAVEIQRSLEKATAAAGIDLVVWDNDRNADTAIRNAEAMADSKVDLAIEFQLFEHVAPVISDILSRSEIPLISLVNPHHGTVYFGEYLPRGIFRGGCAGGTRRQALGFRGGHASASGVTPCRQDYPEQAGGRAAGSPGAVRTVTGEIDSSSGWRW